jgi:hypothetical protein
MRTAQRAAISADRDLATKQAFDACVAADKDLIGPEGPIKPMTAVGRLTSSEWGWSISTAISTWVRIRAAQAAAEGLSVERTIHTTGLTPDPRLEGAVEACLSKLVDTCPDAPWDKAVGDWPKKAVLSFLVAVHDLIQRAIVARDSIEAQLDGEPHPDLLARQPNAVAGNGLLTVAEQRELSDPDAPPF